MGSLFHKTKNIVGRLLRVIYDSMGNNQGYCCNRNAESGFQNQGSSNNNCPIKTGLGKKAILIY